MSPLTGGTPSRSLTNRVENTTYCIGCTVRSICCSRSTGSIELPDVDTETCRPHRGVTEVGEFSTRMVWADDHWDVALTQVADGRARLLANIPLDEWIGLGAMQYVLEVHAEGEGGP
jgi:hypothetical protein